MSKEKQIEEMAKVIGQRCNRDCIPSCDECIAQTLYSAGYRKQEWISVEERLPEDGAIVLTVDSEGERGVCFYEEELKGIFQQCYGLVQIFNITHWMPLPEAPKKGGS